ncbi:DUF6716 putative glycosyltransferase [Ammonicoccus fulvus]|uniref:DUF6716 putative glycosyltransferase n=1 Tax=Ammonicoccus fulvus TaxID=3138240 RepID=A0ABZ3FMV9_9ACTN
MRILTLSDSDSYLKWAVSLTARVPEQWAVRHLVVENVIAPSPAQVEAILADAPGRAIGRTPASTLARSVKRLRPDVVLVAATGPAVSGIMDLLGWGGVLGPDRPVLVTGLPGISFPANELAVRHRQGFDLMVLHSHRERSAYAEVSLRMAGPEIALAHLPFLRMVPPTPAGGNEVVFAAQSLVPAEPERRRALLGALAELPSTLRPVVKVRALAGERQAHNERYPYAELWRGMEQKREIEFRAGSMAVALRRAAGFVTVSSTAVLEAIAAGVPSLVLDEWGVSGELINAVFADSGLLGGLDDLAAGRFATPHPDWLRDNYFHPGTDNDWVERIRDLVESRAEGRLAAYAGGPVESWPTRLRRQLRLQPPAWAWRGSRALRRATGRSRR